MKIAMLKRLGAELDMVVRLRSITEEALVARVVRWIDYEFHGVRDFVDEIEAEKPPKPDKPPKAGT